MKTIVITRQYYFSAILILLVCWGLFYLDKDTKSVSDLFKPGNLFALLLYFVPTYLIWFLLYRTLEKRNTGESFLLSMVIGVPVSIVLVIVVLSYLMGRFD